MMNPLISVIVPVYKVEMYLKRCIDSIVTQTYSNIELILIDDGSPDNCPQICESYKEKDSRIVVIHKKNEGLSAARNKGLDIAHGDYITFIDSDDWVSTEYLSKLYSSIKETNADIAIVNHKQVTDFPVKLSKKNRTIRLFSRQEALFELIARQNQPFVISCGKLYRKELFNAIRFPTGKCHEDEFTSHLLINKVSRIVYSDRTLYFYYQRPDSITRENHILDAIDAFENRLNFTIENNLKDLISFAAINLCWKYLNFAYEKYLKKDDYKHILTKAKKIKSLMHLRRATDLALFIFLQHPKIYFYIKNRKC